MKRKTALLLCFVFAARILFVNIGALTLSSSQQNQRWMKLHFSQVMKRRKISDPSGSTQSPDYPIAAIFDENNAEDELPKSNSFILIQTLYSFLKGIEKKTLSKASFHQYFSYTKLNRYLILQVVRV